MVGCQIFTFARDILPNVATLNSSCKRASNFQHVEMPTPNGKFNVPFLAPYIMGYLFSISYFSTDRKREDPFSCKHYFMSTFKHRDKSPSPF